MSELKFNEAVTAFETEVNASNQSFAADFRSVSELKGDKGDPGISATHEWDGTTLKITSASGTSAADLKGEKGEKGDTGAQGPQGEKGEKGDKGDTGDTGPAYTLNDTDKGTIADAVKASLTTETWTFTLEDGSTVTKAVYIE